MFAKAKDDAKEWSVGEGMEIVVEFKRRMEVCFGEAKALRNRERERVDSPCGDHSSTIAFAQLKTRCASRGNGLLPMSFTYYLVRSEHKTILVDTGVGTRSGRKSHLDKTLLDMQVAPEEH